MNTSETETGEHMLSYHGDQAVKDKYLARVQAHRAADAIVQGTGWENGKGCAIGCTLENYDHSRYPIELGVPIELARLEDRIFEGLPREDAVAWPERFLAAVPVGRDLSLVWPRFAVWILRDLEAKFATRAPKSAKACGDVAALYDQWVAGQKPEAKKWREADAYAYAAADAYAAAAAAADAYAAAAAEKKAYFRKKIDEALAETRKAMQASVLDLIDRMIAVGKDEDMIARLRAESAAKRKAA